MLSADWLCRGLTSGNSSTVQLKMNSKNRFDGSLLLSLDFSSSYLPVFSSFLTFYNTYLKPSLYSINILLHIFYHSRPTTTYHQNGFQQGFQHHWYTIQSSSPSSAIITNQTPSFQSLHSNHPRDPQKPRIRPYHLYPKSLQHKRPKHPIPTLISISTPPRHLSNSPRSSHQSRNRKRHTKRCPSPPRPLPPHHKLESAGFPSTSPGPSSS